MKKIIICAPLESEPLKSLEALAGDPILKDANVEILHCFEVNYYNDELVPFVYPAEDKYPEIADSVMNILKPLEEKLSASAGQLKINCLFDHGPKERVIQYLKDEKADCVIVASKKKSGFEGLFVSSFAENMIRHAPCNVLVVR